MVKTDQRPMGDDKWDEAHRKYIIDNLDNMTPELKSMYLGQDWVRERLGLGKNDERGAYYYFHKGEEYAVKLGKQMHAGTLANIIMSDIDFNDFDYEGGEEEMIGAVLAITSGYLTAGGHLTFGKVIDLGILRPTSIETSEEETLPANGTGAETDGTDGTDADGGTN